MSELGIPARSTTLGDLFEEVGTREPQALAYVEGDQRLTYGQWLAGADSLAAELRARGVAPGDVVAFSMSSCIDYAVAYAACTRLGAVATGIDTRLGPGEVSAILQRCEPVALLHEGSSFAVPAGAPEPKVLMPRTEVAAAWQAGNPFRDRPGPPRRPGVHRLDEWYHRAAEGRLVRPPRARGVGAVAATSSAPTTTYASCRCRSRTPGT